jgi:hypothetical protein
VDFLAIGCQGDLKTLARDTHKFEPRYLDWLIGPYPQDRETYVGRQTATQQVRVA